MIKFIFIIFFGLFVYFPMRGQNQSHRDWSISVADSIVIPYDIVESKFFSFKEQMAPVVNTVTRKYGFVNPKGEIVIPCMYDFAREFHCGRSAVFDAAIGKWGYINRENELIVPFIYDYVSDFGYDRNDDPGLAGLAYVNIGISNPEEQRFRYFTDGKWGLINTNGDIILPIKYGDIARPIENMAYIVDGERVDTPPYSNVIGKMGFVNRKGIIVIPVEYEYDYDAAFIDGYVTLKKDGVAFQFNMKGEIVNKMPLYGQNKDPFNFDTKDSLFWNNEVYACNQSPISCFDGYWGLYPAVVTSRKTRTWKINYVVNWTVIDSMLYLCDAPLISYLNEPDYDNNRHIVMEKLTAGKFEMPSFSIPDYLKPRINPHGLLFAHWYSDALYLKKYKGHPSMISKTKEKESVLMLLFSNGKIVKIEEYQIL